MPDTGAGRKQPKRTADRGGAPTTSKEANMPAPDHPPTGASDSTVALPGSERFARADARAVAPVDPERQVEVTVYIRRDPDAPPLPPPEEVAAGTPLGPLSDEEFASRYRARQDDIDQVTAFARDNGLEVGDVSPVKRSVVLRGPAERIESAFGVRLQVYQFAGGQYRGREGAVHVPEALSTVIEAVLGLDDRPVGRSRLRGRSDRRVSLDQARAGQLPPNAYLPPRLARLYQYPPGTDGTGQCVGILAFNNLSGTGSPGGYRIDALRTYFENVLQQTTPEIVDVVVHGPGNQPGDDGPQGAASGDSSGEIMLDVQVVGAVAPGAKIVMYFTEFSERGWVDAINAAITDTGNRPSVISVSYGNPERDPNSAWTAVGIRKVNEAFAAAAARGITICCASGDDGSRDRSGNLRANADFPASSPYVLACGGTRVFAWDDIITYEVVWNDGPGSATGGGVSDVFDLPVWQRGAGVPPSANLDRRIGRGIPDVSGVADPETGAVIITLDARHLAVIGGTSLTAPLWSALVARLNQGLGTRLGFLNPVLYLRLAQGVLRDIIWGNNGAYHAGPGWDPCTGLGSPNGVMLLNALRAVIPPTNDEAFGQRRSLEPFMAALYQLVTDLSTGDPVVVENVSRLNNAYAAYVRLALEAASPGPAAGDVGDRLRNAYDDYVEGLRDLLQGSTWSDQVRRAYEQYAALLKEAWANVDVSTLDVATLTGIAQTIAAAVSQPTALLSMTPPTAAPG